MSVTRLSAAMIRNLGELEGMRAELASRTSIPEDQRFCDLITKTQRTLEHEARERELEKCKR